jgi:predicted DNA-binding transcriptional regulator YafY
MVQEQVRKMKLDRLVSIITVLLRRERVPARKLAELFEVSVRTILRDVEAINLAGIPIVTFPGAGGGIGIAEGYKLDRSVLTGDEMAALLTGLKGMSASLGDAKLGVLLDKIKNAIPQSQLEAINLKTSQIVVELSPWGVNEQMKGALATLRNAIESQREVAFTYVGSDGRKTERTVQPYTLILKGTSWYLYGWCALREAFRLFKVARIREMRALESRFERVETEYPAAMNIPDGKGGETARCPDMLLAFDPSAENAVIEWFGGEWETGEDGRLLVHARMPENNWLYSFLLGFGPAMEILEPEYLRDIVADMAKRIFDKYNKGS